MATEYVHRVVIACPGPLIDRANHLSCILGGSSKDIGTFGAANYANEKGEAYSVVSTVVKPEFLAAQVEGLPSYVPAHAVAADINLATEAMDSINQPGGILMAVDVDPHQQFAKWGLERLNKGHDI